MGDIQIHLTLDYEVWGNGDGCVHKCMIEPTDKMLKLADKYNLKLTLFVEMCEYWAFKELEEKRMFKDPNYLPGTWIDTQLKDVIKRGYDVQLHFHPQWLNYKYVEDQTFDLDLSMWKISSLPLGDKDVPHSLVWLFSKGKKDLEDLLKPVRSDYSVTTFRAGAWCIQPEKKVLEAMEKVGIYKDSTVAPKLFLEEKLTAYNFSDAPLKNGWKFESAVCEESNSGKFTELPIHTSEFGIIKNLIFTIYKIGTAGSISNGCEGKGISSNKFSLSRIITKLLRKFQMFDVTGGLSSKELIYHYKRAKERYAEELKVGDVELLAIGHPKNFHSEIEFVNFIEFTKKTS